MLVVSLLEQIKSYGNHVGDKKLVNHDYDDDTYDDADEDTDDHNFRKKDRYNAAGPAPDAGVAPDCRSVGVGLYIPWQKL